MSRTTHPASGPPLTSARARLVHGLGERAAKDAAAGARDARALGRAAAAEHLEVGATGLVGARVLAGHVLGLHLLIPAGGLHGPRETPAFVYLFADALAVRPSDDAPMSTIPVLGLHMILPPAAVTRWVYKAGRVEHANLDVLHDAQRFAASIDGWTVDDFADADPKLIVYKCDELAGPLHVYDHLGFAHVWLPVPDTRPARLKSALPSTPEAFAKLWALFGAVTWLHGLTMDAPHEVPADPPPA